MTNTNTATARITHSNAVTGVLTQGRTLTGSEFAAYLAQQDLDSLYSGLVAVTFDGGATLTSVARKNVTAA